MFLYLLIFYPHMRTLRNMFKWSSFEFPLRSSLAPVMRLVSLFGRGMVFGTGILATFLVAFVGYFVYAAYTQLPTATSGAPLTSTMWNNAMTAINQHGTDLSNLITTVGTLTGAIMVNGSKVGIGTANPAEAIDTNGGNIKMGYSIPYNG